MRNYIATGTEPGTASECGTGNETGNETGEFSARLPSVLLSPNVVDCHRICLHFVYQFLGLVQGRDEVPECPARPTSSNSSNGSRYKSTRNWANGYFGTNTILLIKFANTHTHTLKAVRR